jgi:hypothetical protein
MLGPLNRGEQLNGANPFCISCCGSSLYLVASKAGPCQKLVQVASKMDRTAIVAQGREISRSLPVKQAEFLEFAPVQAAQAAARALVQQ